MEFSLTGNSSRLSFDKEFRSNWEIEALLISGKKTWGNYVYFKDILLCDLLPITPGLPVFSGCFLFDGVRLTVVDRFCKAVASIGAITGVVGWPVVRGDFWAEFKI